MNMSRVVCSAIAGNALEIYDMIIYGLLAPVISQHFFPKQTKLIGIASIFAIFFTGYLARPLGALLFGQMGDRLGRKPALLVSIWLIAISTSALGVLPSYNAVGVWAPLLLLIVRILQGLSLGGELMGSTIFTVEHAPRAQRGFYGSFVDTGASLGFLFASFAAWLIHSCFNDLQVVQWAWRLPFLLSLLGGLVGWLVRRGTSETELFLETHRLPNTYFDLRRAYAKQLRPAMLIVGIKLFSSVIGYLFFVFMITYMSTELGYTPQQALGINTVAIMLLVFLEPCMGKLSDRIGRRPLMIFSLVGMAIWAWPYFWLLHQHNVALALLAQCVTKLFALGYLPISMITMVEIVPVQMRFTVVSVAYAIAASLFSGMTPFVATLLLIKTHTDFSLILFLWIAALISLFAIYKTRETRYVPENIEQNVQDRIRQIARNRLASGDSVEKVAAITALSEDEVAAIQDEVAAIQQE